MEIGRHTAPAATPWRCLCLKGRGWRTWMRTRLLGLSVLVSTAVRGCTLEGREATRISQPVEAASTTEAPPPHSTVAAIITPKRWL